MPLSPHNVELAFYANDTAILGTPRKVTLIVSYMESYLKDFQWWLSEWRTMLRQE